MTEKEEIGCYFCEGCKDIEQYHMNKITDFQYKDSFTRKIRWMGCECKDFNPKKVKVSFT